MDGDTGAGSPMAPRKPLIAHYYGDQLRKLFLGAAIVTLAILPFYSNLIPDTPLWLVIGVSLIVVVFAGVTNPKTKIIAYIDLFIAAVLFFFFQYVAVTHYSSDPLIATALRQIIALVYLVAIYLSSKTVRGMLVK